MARPRMGRRVGGGGGWTPASAGKPILWLDANRGITTSSGLVTDWQSVSSYNGVAPVMSQATSGSRPAFSATGWDSSRPGVTFSGGSKWLANTTDSFLYNPFNAALNFTLLARINTSGSAAYRTLMSWTDVPATVQFHAWPLDPSNHHGMSFSSGSLIAGTVNSSGKKSVVWTCDNSTGVGYVDGVGSFSGAFGSNIVTARAILGLDGLFSGSPYTGTIAEVVLYNFVLSANDLLAWETYASRKWP